MNKSERAALVQRYTQGHSVVVEALAGITPAELDARHDGWSAREVVHHLADSEMTSAIRLRRLLAEDRPVIDGYDEETFARVPATPSDRSKPPWTPSPPPAAPPPRSWRA